MVGHRNYNPEWGRWIQPDDIEYLDPTNINGLNLYAYCMNDPVNMYDPTGHFAVTSFLIGLGVSALVGAVVGAASYTTGQVVEYALSGTFEWSWGALVGSTIGGSIGGAAVFMMGGLGTTALGAFVSGFATEMGSMIGENISDNAGYSFGDILINSTITGGFSILTAGVMDSIKLSGINYGKGSWTSISKQITTKLYNGTIKNVAMKSIGKMLGAAAYGSIASVIFDGVYSASGTENWVLSWF